jgi:hypothetical protein
LQSARLSPHGGAVQSAYIVSTLQNLDGTVQIVSNLVTKGVRIVSKPSEPSPLVSQRPQKSLGRKTSGIIQQRRQHQHIGEAAWLAATSDGSRMRRTGFGKPVQHAKYQLRTVLARVTRAISGAPCHWRAALQQLIAGCGDSGAAVFLGLTN